MKKTYNEGLTVNGGVVKANATVIRSSADMDNMKDGNILIVQNSDPMYALCVFKASGLVCENGGRLSHICVVALEMGIPCLTQVRGVTSEIRDGQTVYLDASERILELVEE